MGVGQFWGGAKSIGAGGLELVISTGGDGICVIEFKNFQISDLQRLATSTPFE